MEISFRSYKDFLKEYAHYHTHECDNCGGLCELSNEDVDIVIDSSVMHFRGILMIACTECKRHYLPLHTKQMIDGCYKTMIKQGYSEGEHRYKGYRQKFDYCKSVDLIYDHRDYFNIPGLCIDEEHSVEGFLTPVYFTKKVLLYFYKTLIILSN